MALPNDGDHPEYELQTLNEVLTHSVEPSVIWKTLNMMDLSLESHPYLLCDDLEKVFA